MNSWISGRADSLSALLFAPTMPASPEEHGVQPKTKTIKKLELGLQPLHFLTGGNHE
jgi:hypothetical protein